MVLNYNKFINEKLNNLSFKEETEEDRTTIEAYLNNERVGKVTIEVIYQAYEYEFSDILTEEEFDNIFSDDNIVKIENIEVSDKHKGSGIGTKLMDYAMVHMKSNGHEQFFLNASPMGFNGLRKHQLVTFYKKFGFEEILDQGNNTIMGVNLES